MTVAAIGDRARCWDCGAKNDGYTAGNPDVASVPDAGAVSICFYCGAFSVYTGEVAVCDCGEAHPVYLFRKPTDDELAELEADPNLQAYRSAVGRARALVARGEE